MELLAETIRYNLGIPVHYYARINFAGVREMIDRVGGVDVLAHCPLYDVFPDLPPEQNDIITDTVALSTVPTGRSIFRRRGCTTSTANMRCGLRARAIRPTTSIVRAGSKRCCAGCGARSRSRG